MSFFELFPSFEPDPKASIKKEFDRLAQQQNWPQEVAERFRASFMKMNWPTSLLLRASLYP